jgi:DNA-dependent protein kinase catalytic subunit
MTLSPRVSSDKAKSATNVCYELFCADGVHSDEVRRAVAERFLVPMLKNVHKLVLLDFFVHHIGHMMGTLTAKLGKAPDDLLCQLSSRLCVCEMLTVLYERLTSVELSTPTGQVNRSFCEKFGRTVEHGKELTREITKVCNDAKSEDVRHEITHKELRRQYHCAAYKVLVALMCCTQTEMKFYTGFLFKEDLIKHQLLWDNLIDAEKTYEFAAELESPMFRKGQLNAIRQQVKTKEEETVNEDWHAPRYLSSQYLADSSLREEVSQFDFSTLSQVRGVALTVLF